jgi:hypothetical protein
LGAILPLELILPGLHETESIFTDTMSISVPHPFAFFLAKGWENMNFRPGCPTLAAYLFVRLGWDGMMQHDKASEKA